MCSTRAWRPPPSRSTPTERCTASTAPVRMSMTSMSPVRGFLAQYVGFWAMVRGCLTWCQMARRGGFMQTMGLVQCVIMGIFNPGGLRHLRQTRYAPSLGVWVPSKKRAKAEARGPRFAALCPLPTWFKSRVPRARVRGRSFNGEAIRASKFSSETFIDACARVTRPKGRATNINAAEPGTGFV